MFSTKGLSKQQPLLNPLSRRLSRKRWKSCKSETCKLCLIWRLELLYEEKWEMRNEKMRNRCRWVHWKKGENGRQPRPNSLVVSAGKWAASMAAENCTSCRKSIRTLSISVYGRANIFCEAHFLLPIASLGRDRREQGSTFSGQVSAIEARDEAIFTKIMWKIQLIAKCYKLW